jgi:phage tail-like protein
MNIGQVLDVIPSGVMGFLGSALLSQLGLVRIDHPMKHEFFVEIDGIIDSGFESAEGLSDRATPFEIESVTSSSSQPIFPYKRQVGMVTLKKGITYKGSLEKWYYDCINFKIGQRTPLKNVDFIQCQRLPKGIPWLGGQLVEIKRWSYPLCVCRDITFPKFNSTDDGISVNELIIQTTKPDWVGKPSDFGSIIGTLLDALQR